VKHDNIRTNPSNLIKICATSILSKSVGSYIDFDFE